MHAQLQIANRSSRVELLESEVTTPLSNGLIAWCGRITPPRLSTVKDGDVCTLTVESDNRSGEVRIVSSTETELYFVGVLR